MNNRNLNYFLEIAKQKNLSKAASYLFLTQSSLSQFLAKEEEELGVKLFIRDKKGLKLTYAGELYKETCEKILEIQSEHYARTFETGFSDVSAIFDFIFQYRYCAKCM